MSASQPPTAPPGDAASQPPGAGPAGRPPRARRRGFLRRAFLLLLLVLAMTTGAVLLFPDQLLLPWLLPAARAAARARGFELSVAHVSGGFSDTLELRDVRLSSRDPDLPGVELDLPVVDVHWSPWRAVTGAADPLDGISVAGGSLRLDLRRGAAGTTGAWTPGTLARLEKQLDALPPLDIDHLGVELVAPSAGLLATPDLAVRATLHVQGRTLDIMDGTLAGDGPDGRLPGGLALVAPARLDLSQLGDDELPFALELAGLDGVLGLQGRLHGDVLEARVTAVGVQLAALWRAATRETAPPPLDGALLAGGDVRVPLGAGGLAANARFTLGPTAAFGLELDAASGSLAWDDGVLHASDVQLRQGGNLFVLEDALLPAAVLAEIAAQRTVPWDVLAVSGRLDVADLPALLAALRTVHVLPAPQPSDPASLAQQFATQATAGEHRLLLHAALGDGALTVRKGMFRTTGGTLEVPAASLDLRAADLADAALAVQLDADFADLSPLGALLGEAPFPGSRSSAWAGSLAAHVRLSGSLRAPVAQVDVDGHELLAGGWPLGALGVQAVADAQRVEVHALELAGPAAHVSAQGAITLDTLQLANVRVQLDVPDLAALLPGTELQGALDANAALDGPLPLPLGTLELHGSHLVRNGLALDELRIAATHLPGLLVVSDATLRTPQSALRTAGSLRLAEPLPMGSAPSEWIHAVQELRLDRFAVARGGLELTLAEPVTLQHAGLRWSGGPLQLSGSAGSLRATLGIAAAAAGTGTLQRVQLVAENLKPLLALPSGSSVDQLDGDLDLAFGPGELSANGTLRALGLSLAADDSPLGARVVGDFTAWLAVTGSADAPRGQVELSARRLQLTAPTRLAPQGFGPCTLDAHVTLGEQVTVDWLRVDSPHEVHLDASGTLDLPADYRTHLPDTALHLRLSVSAGRLDRLSELLTDVRRLSGDLAAELTVDGTLGEPRAHGSVVVHDGELRLQGAVPPLDALEARLELEGERLSIRELTGELGSAPFTMSGEALLGKDGASLDIALRGEDLLFYRADGVTVRADSDLSLRGPLTGLSVTGKLVVRNSGVVSSVNLLHLAQGGGGGKGHGMRLFSFQEPPLSGLRFDVRITAAEPFIVRNSVVRGGMRPDLRLTGTGKVPILDGTVTVEASRVVLPAGSVNVDSGRVLFSAADPFVPRLDIEGSARRRGYTIKVLVTGPYDQPVVSLSSVPPLASDKILLLLLTGQAPGRGAAEPAGSDTTTHVVAVYLGQDLLARWLGDSPLGDDGLLDRLDVEVVKDVSRSNSDLLQVSYRLTDVPKRGGSVTFLRAEKDLYNRINFGMQFLFRLEQ